MWGVSVMAWKSLGIGTRLAALSMMLAFAAGQPASAQSPFSPVARVGERAVTGYEVAQRMLLLEVLGTAAPTEENALDGLIDERVQLAEADRLDLLPDDEAVRAGMTEFAARNDMTAEEFVARLTEAGIAEATFRDFVAAGIAWRDVVRGRFLSQVAITADEIDRQIAQGPDRGRLRVLLSEIFLPARTPEEAAAADQRMQSLALIRGSAAFSQAARDMSAAPSRADGGQIDWLDLNTLPAPLRTQLLGLSPGQVTAPLSLPNARAIFLLRAIDAAPPQVVGPVTVDAARLTMSDADEVARIRTRADTCNDLYALAADLPPEALSRTEARVDDLASDLALTLARLDPGESVVEPIPGGGATLVMLCARSVLPRGEAPDRDAVRQAILNQKLLAKSETYLAELRARTPISRRN